jgi:regulator of cell morphogenesis and NO signaling
MQTIRSDQTLGTLVTTFPELAREFERRRLDYCCGGQASLADACRDAGLDVGEVIGELEQVAVSAAPADWASLDAVALVDHVEGTHHRYLWDEMPRLSDLAATVRRVHGDRHPELAAIVATYEALRADLEPHLRKEERVLFPMIRDLAASIEAGAPDAPSFHCGSLRNPISVMLAEHDTAGNLLDRLRDLTDDYRTPADGCASYRALFEGLELLDHDTHLHVHKENHRLFPMVVEMEDAARSATR